MIKTLYDKFKPWSEYGSVWLISDTHFDDEDCLLMDTNWISPQQHIDKIKEYVHKNDTLIHLGDVGNPEYMKQIKAYKVLIMGNHDESITRFKPYFDEIYTGPVFISQKILLSHESINGGNWWFNIHGHNHDKENKYSWNEVNLASNVVDFGVFNLGIAIKRGMLADIDGIHRDTINKATEKKFSE